jgi:hypothetical protein
VTGDPAVTLEADFVGKRAATAAFEFGGLGFGSCAHFVALLSFESFR